MAVTANFQGRTFSFPDGTTDEQIYAQLNSQMAVGQKGEELNAPPQQPAQPEQSWGLYQGEGGSILDTMGKRWDTAKEAFFASQTGESRSNYANTRMKQAVDAQRESQSKLGLAGNMLTAAPELAATIGAGMINPYLGGAVGSTLYSAQNLGEQAMEGKAPDLGNAIGWGMAAGAVDAATGGLAGRFKQGLQVTKPLARTAAHIGVNTAEDVTSSVAGAAFTNISAGRDWDTGLEEAALMGAGVGAGLRGTLRGLNKVMPTAHNKGGDEALKTAQESYVKTGKEFNPGSVEEAYVYGNKSAEWKDNLMNSKTDDDIRLNADELVNSSSIYGGDAAAMKAMSLLGGSGIDVTNAGFNFNFNTHFDRTGKEVNFGEKIGLDQATMSKDADRLSNAEQAIFGREKAKEAGETKASYTEQFKHKAEELSGKVAGTYDANNTLARSLISRLKNDPGATSEELMWANRLQDSLHMYKKRADEYVDRDLDTSASIKEASKDILFYASKLGVTNDLVGVNGKAGSFDPVNDVMARAILEKSLNAQVPTYKVKMPDAAAEKPKGTVTPLGTVADIAMSTLPGGVAMIGAKHLLKGAKNLAHAKGTQKDLRKAKTEGTQRLASLNKALGDRQQAALSEGDAPGASAASVDALNAAGITTKPVMQDAPSVLDPVVTPEPIQAPMTSPIFKSAPLVPREPTMPQRAVEEPVAPMPEPEPVVAPEPVKTEAVPARKPTRKEKKAAKMEEAKAKPKPEMAKAPTKPKVEEPAPAKVEEPEPVTVPEPEVDVPVEAPRSDSKKMAAKPKQPIKEEAKAPEKAPEESTEAPKPKTASIDLVRKPLEQKKAQFEDMTVKQRETMLKADPEKYRDLQRAKDDLQLADRIIDNLSSQHRMSKEAVADYINEMGGLEKVRKEMRERGESGKEQQIIKKRIAELEELKKKEMKTQVEELRKKAVPVVESKPEVDSAQVNADTHMAVRNELSSLGYSKEVMDEALKKANATDTTKPVDPKIVRNWARTIEKQRVAEAKAAADLAASKATEAVKRSTAHSKKPMPEAERRALERDLSEQISAHEAMVKAKGVAPADRTKAQVKLDQLKDSLKKVSEEQTKLNADKVKAEAEAKEATKAMEQTRREYESLFKEADKRMDKIEQANKNQSKLAEQQKDMTEALKALGAPEATAQKILHNMFISRQEPLKDAEFSKYRAKAVQELEAQTKESVKKAKATVQPEVAKMSDAELEVAAKDVTEASREVKDFSAPEVQAVNEALADELRARGKKNEATYMETFNDTVVKAENMKKQFPDNRELWISSDAKQALQKQMSKAGGAYMGNLGKQLSSRFYGDAEAGNKFMRYSDEEIKARIEGGKIDSDIVVQPRKSWKEIGRKTVKSRA